MSCRIVTITKFAEKSVKFLFLHFFIFTLLETDTRRSFAISLPMPLVSFVLCSPSNSSPRLKPLYDSDIDKLNIEFRKRAQSYIQLNVKYDVNSNKVHLPGIFQSYHKDFCFDKATDIVRTIINLSVSEETMSSDLKRIISSKKLKLTYSPILFSPTIIL